MTQEVKSALEIRDILGNLFLPGISIKVLPIKVRYAKIEIENTFFKKALISGSRIFMTSGWRNNHSHSRLNATGHST